MPDSAARPGAAASGTFTIAGELEVHRLGFGAMRLTGRGIWGQPSDPDECRRVLRRALELGVNFIDTAESYGPQVSERLIAEALHPYPAGLVIATKGGLNRAGPNRWQSDARPQRLREACEGSLRRLRLECIDLYQLHRIDGRVPLEDQLGTLRDLQAEGKIRLIGLSEVGEDDLRRARGLAAVATVQNRFNLVDRAAEPVLEMCEREHIGFIPWFPLATGRLAAPGGQLDVLARERAASPAQLALAWLLARSPVMLPIPGTASVSHLEENVAAAELEFSEAELAELAGSAAG